MSDPIPASLASHTQPDPHPTSSCVPSLHPLCSPAVRSQSSRDTRAFLTPSPPCAHPCLSLRRHGLHPSGSATKPPSRRLLPPPLRQPHPITPAQTAQAPPPGVHAACPRRVRWHPCPSADRVRPPRRTPHWVSGCSTCSASWARRWTSWRPPWTGVCASRRGRRLPLLVARRRRGRRGLAWPRGSRWL